MSPYKSGNTQHASKKWDDPDDKKTMQAIAKSGRAVAGHGDTFRRLYRAVVVSVTRTNRWRSGGIERWTVSIVASAVFCVGQCGSIGRPGRRLDYYNSLGTARVASRRPLPG